MVVDTRKLIHPSSSRALSSPIRLRINDDNDDGESVGRLGTRNENQQTQKRKQQQQQQQKKKKKKCKGRKIDPKWQRPRERERARARDEKGREGAGSNRKTRDERRRDN
ncbi:hypothetical protein AXG93_1474s1130 [Marchantia polymorpha subsp. ruderalis]|uniref:Uncharacterized protein n=1 Tax=Marchantia polymorpha subsp. ruderalis TaxID=1480154 RepID=A0A176WAF5_MARPO|nr:hypothetical protein AXG93_1474s1130 [Marchantia polymorpha subsp. ruderalis]